MSQPCSFRISKNVPLPSDPKVSNGKNLLLSKLLSKCLNGVMWFVFFLILNMYLMIPRYLTCFQLLETVFNDSEGGLLCFFIFIIQLPSWLYSLTSFAKLGTQNHFILFFFNFGPTLFSLFFWGSHGIILSYTPMYPLGSIHFIFQFIFSGFF